MYNCPENCKCEQQPVYEPALFVVIPLILLCAQNKAYD